MESGRIKKILEGSGLRVTPQRTATLLAVNELNHPTAEAILVYVRENHFDMAKGTVYKILDTFLERKLVSKVLTENDIVRYDSITEAHHHLYSMDVIKEEGDVNKVEDYFDEELNKILHEYFQAKQIPNFHIERIQLQIFGKFKDK